MFNSGFNNRFNTSFQNSFADNNIDQPLSIGGMDTAVPAPMPGNLTESELYPFESSPYDTQNTPRYAKGGRVKRKKKKEQNNPYPLLAELIRQQGDNGDEILAHINPLEAEVLGLISGGGTINPVTGLPQFSFWSNPKKVFKNNLATAISFGPVGALATHALPKKAQKSVRKFNERVTLPVAGSILGNTIMPGIGGVIGGSLGGGIGAAAGDRNIGKGALRGAIVGGSLPTVSSLLGSGASALGFNSIGSGLSSYGAENAILPSLGFGQSSGISGVGAGGDLSNPLREAISRSPSSVASASPMKEQGFLEKLSSNTSNFFSKPKNLLTMATVAGSFMNRPKSPKEKSPEQLANEEKRRMKASRLTPAELAEQEAYDLAVEQARRRNERNKFLPEERIHIAPLYRKVNTPEERKARGRWLEYYNNNDFSGEPVNFKKGGFIAPEIEYEAAELEYPSGLGYFLRGGTGGQDDLVKASFSNGEDAYLSDGEYVMPADVVAHIGDGNTEAGAKKFDQMIASVRKHKTGNNKFPPKSKSLNSYMR